MISNFQVFVNNFFKFFIKQGYKDSNLEMTESESVALPFGDSPICFVLDEVYTIPFGIASIFFNF